MDKAIYFDMDGTIADLYGVENWLKRLENFDTTPYGEAKTMFNLTGLARRLKTLQRKGYRLGIVSWLSKTSDELNDVLIEWRKLNWLKQHLPSIVWDEIHIVAYGTPKSEVVEFPNGILFDDEAKNRNEWKGLSFNEKVIMEVLKDLK